MGLPVNSVSEGEQVGASQTHTTAENAYGKRLIPHIIDQKASQEPQRECFQIACSSLPEDGWRTVTFGQFANAINKCCHLIIGQCGQPMRDTFPTIAYIGPSDARYLVLMLAAVKTGYKALFISPRNSLEGQLDLFEKTDSRILAFAQTQQPMIQPWLHQRDMKTIEISPLDAWFPAEPEVIAHYPFNKTFEEAEWEPLCVLHTSGSTGLPKPVLVRQGMLAIIDAYHAMGEWQGMDIYMREWAARAKRIFMAMPLFHAAGIYVSILTIAYWDIPIALSIADRPLSAEFAVETLKHLDVQGAIIPPSVLEDMSRDDEGVKALSKLKVVPFGGGSLSTESGDRLVQKGVRLMSVVAATECCTLPVYCSKDPSMWQWFAFRFEEGECEWRKQGDEDIYEQVIVRQGKEPGLQPFFYTFPDKDEISTNDLYKPHPTVPNLWMHQGRVDDLIVLSNGEKLHPATIEDIVGAHPQVKGALVVGVGRFQPGLILEPTNPVNDQEQSDLIESVWPWIERANKETAAHGRISRDLVMVAKPEKPFLRAGKGTLQKPPTLKLYAPDIDDLYEMATKAAAISASTKGSSPLDFSSEEALTRSIGNLFHDHLGGPVLEPDDDFFFAGIDSLQVISATRLLRGSLETGGHNPRPGSLTPRAVYNNPTARQLARYIIRTRKASEGSSDDGNDTGSRDQEKTMAALLEKYTVSLHRGVPGRPDPASEGQTVVLTGSTGALGSYLLDALARSPRVSRVICLNRAVDGGAAQQARAFAERGLLDDDAAAAPYATKTEFHHADPGRAGWGLPAAVYARLLREADRVILNAWPVHFHLGVTAFEPHVGGVRAAADLAARAAKRVAVLFVSSIASVGRWDAGAPGGGGGGPVVPEVPLADLSLAVGGYGASKLVAGLVLDAAAAAGDFPAAVIRVGQIAGPEADAGVWNRHEWFPCLVASSLLLGAFPADLAAQRRVDWTPVERIARLVLEVGGMAQDAVPIDAVRGYYHGVSPAATTWSEIAGAVRDFYGEERLPEMVPFREWVRRLERSGQEETGAALEQNPGLKLLDTYKDMVRSEETGQPPVVLAMERTVALSPTMRNSEAITSDMVKQWCKHWNF